MENCFNSHLDQNALSQDRRYVGSAFKPTNLCLSGAYCSNNPRINWNRPARIQREIPPQSFDYYEPSNNYWQNAAIYRSRSVEPSNLITDSNELMSSVYPSRRCFATLQRQHKSLDGMQSNECEADEIPTLLPLDISAANTGMTSSQYVGASLSNPTTTNAYFWKQPTNPQSYGYDAYGPTDTQSTRAYDLLKHDYEMAMQKLNSTMNSIKTFWSPELKRERQLRKEETAKLAALQRQVGSQNSSAFRVAELEAELENCRCELAEKDETVRRLMDRASAAAAFRDGGSRMADLETRCNQLESLLEIREEQIRSMERHLSQLPISSSQAAKDQRIADLEDEIAMLRSERAELPRDFTDKTVTPHEINTLRMKMERSEVELAQKTAELSAVQARLQAATEAVEDLRKRVEVFRESSTAKEKHAVLLQSDIEALRAKLETKNTQIEQKEKACERLEAEITVEKGRVSDLRDSNRNFEQKINQLVARIDSLESLLHDKESELEKAKQKLLAHPDVQKEEELQLQIDEANREKLRMQSLIDELRHSAEKEKVQQLEAFQAQNRQLITTIESLQKELADRQVLLESQSEKIGDLDRELITAERQKDRTPQPSNDEELAEARKEIDSLLRMVQTLEKEKASLITQCKQLQSKLEDTHKDDTVSAVGQLRPEFSALLTDGSLKSRVEELEEALRESVSITAERELHVAQQKQLSQQLAAQLTECRRELNELRRRVKKLTSSEREEMLRSLEAEKRRHIEQLLQLKHEALVAAIAEKDAHIALLEQSRERPREEIETLRHHKEKLMEKLKEENERRAQLLSSADMTMTSDLLQEGTLAAAIPAASVSAPASVTTPRQVITDQEDDAEGIWA